MVSHTPPRSGLWSAFSLVLFATVLGFLPRNANGQLYLGQGTNIVEYNVNGSAMNTSLVTGLNNPQSIVVSGNTLYVASFGSNTIGEYDATTGATINANFIAGLNGPEGLALAGNILYVADFTGNTVGEYNASTGAVINANFITGLNGSNSLTLAGNHLYVSNETGQSVGEYDATTGAAVSGFQFDGASQSPRGVAVSGNHLFLAIWGTNGEVSEYDATTGKAINLGFISGLNLPRGLAVSGNTLFVTFQSGVNEYDVTTGAFIRNIGLSGSTASGAIAVVPEPATGGMLGLGLAALAAVTCRRRRRS